jgi:hypothetical protein
MLDRELQEIRERVNVTPYRGTTADARKLLDEVDRLRDLLRRADLLIEDLEEKERSSWRV